MRITRRLISASVATAFIVGIAIQNLGTAQAEKRGYIQADCPTIVKQAIDTVGAECSKAGRNKLCYGNSTIQVVLQSGAGNSPFQSPGDTLDVSQIQQFTLGGMDTTTNTWGVTELKIQADLPNTNPTQNVTMILFGDVQVTNADSDANAAALTQTPGAIAQQNQYATATSRTIDQQATHEVATATKIAGLEGTATAKALTPTPTGTIPAFKVTQAAATATKLAVFQDTATAAPIPQTPIPGAVSGPYKDLQAFYFQSSDTAPCDQAPHDGILIQSPQGAQRVKLSINGATISLGSTVYVTAQANHYLTINTLEGVAEVTVSGQTLSALPGTAIQVPLDANLRASGPPAAAGFYSADAVRALPIAPLPNPIIAVPGMPSNAVATNWIWVADNGTGSCDNHDKSYNIPTTMIGDAGSNYLWVNGMGIVLVKSSEGIYQGTLILNTDVSDIYYTYVFFLQFVDATHMTGKEITTLTDPGTGGCTSTQMLSITKTDAPP